MGKEQQIRITMPDAKALKKIHKNLHLTERQQLALQTTLQDAVTRSVDLENKYKSAESQKALRKIYSELSNIEAVLKRRDVAKALPAIDDCFPVADIISSKAAHLIARSRQKQISPMMLTHLASRDKRSPIFPSEIEELLLNEKRKLISNKTPETINFIIRFIRASLKEWLESNKGDAGGNVPKLSRELMIFLLIRDISLLTDKPSIKRNGAVLLNLCNEILPACGISVHGLEHAISRCRKKYADYLPYLSIPKRNMEVSPEKEASQYRRVTRKVLATARDSEAKLK